MTREEVFAKIRELDKILLLYAGEELRASRSHCPGEHQERYRDLRKGAAAINKLKMDWFYLMPPPMMIKDLKTGKIECVPDSYFNRDVLPLRVK